MVIGALFVLLLAIGAATTNSKKAPSTSTVRAPAQPTAPESTAPATVATKSKASPCVTGSGNGALGLSVTAFRAKNDTNQPPNPAPGDVAYTILKTAHGCVTAFRVDIWTSPNPNAQQALDSIGPQLADAPGGTTETDGGGTCVIWSSPALEQTFGFRYAIAESSYPGIGDSALAEITLWNPPTCSLPVSAFGSSDANGL